MESEFDLICRHVQGICDYVAKNMKDMHGLDVDPTTDVVICCGQTEAFSAAMFACKFSLCLVGCNAMQDIAMTRRKIYTFSASNCFRLCLHKHRIINT